MIHPSATTPPSDALKMSAFINQKNQQILWDIIQKKEVFHKVLTDEQKPIWFKQVIGMFYHQYMISFGLRSSDITPVSRGSEMWNIGSATSPVLIKELENLNKGVIEYMISSLYDIQSKASVQPPRVLNPKKVSWDLSRDEGKKQSMTEDFIRPNQTIKDVLAAGDRRYEEYEPRRNISEMQKIEDVLAAGDRTDTPQQNIEELLKEQQKMRELEIPPLVDVGTHQSRIKNGGKMRPMPGHVRILENTQLPLTNVKELDTEVVTNPSEIREILEEIKKEMAVLKHDISSLREIYKLHRGSDVDQQSPADDAADQQSPVDDSESQK